MLVWDAASGKEVGRLLGHDLSVTDVAFSPRGTRLLSVARDRSVAVFERDGVEGADKFVFREMVRVPAAHARVINSCAWLGEDIVASGGRDKWVKLFAVRTYGDDKERLPVGACKFDAAVTALDCTEVDGVGGHVLVVGLENGNFIVMGVSEPGVRGEGVELTKLFKAGTRMRCGGPVSSVQWRPRRKGDEVGVREVAVGRDDMSVRVLLLHFNVNVTRA